ncbi:MAG: outer membrane lipoprotein carrier protein LolA [Deltaproteobacteria bacterium]|nr:outer membrane lipoprotein carrier protein LolA [Deltaproteobacteria bacterium]
MSNDTFGLRSVFVVFAVCIATWFGSAASAEAPDALGALLERFKTVEGWSARFVEEKKIELLSQPLVNSGRIDYSRPRRLERRTLRPFESLWRLEEFLVTIEDAGEQTTIDLRRYPEAHVLATALMDVLEGDIHRLRKNFDVSFAAQHAENPWTLELKPPRNHTGALFRRIEISGLGVTLRRLVVVERSGDTSTTDFSTLRIEPSADRHELNQTHGVR